MSTVEQKPPMTREEWESAMAEIHAKLDSIPDEIPDKDIPWSAQAGLIFGILVFGLTLVFLLERSIGGSIVAAFAFAIGACSAILGMMVAGIRLRLRGR